MWQAKYTDINMGGLHDEVSVTVHYFNDVDSRTFEYSYSVLPEDIDTDVLKVMVKKQIDAFNTKGGKLAQKQDVIAQPIDVSKTVIPATSIISATSVLGG